MSVAPRGEEREQQRDATADRGGDRRREHHEQHAAVEERAGAVVGAFSFEYVMHLLKDLPAFGDFDAGKHWQLWMGLFILVVVIAAPRGLLGLADKLLTRKGSDR